MIIAYVRSSSYGTYQVCENKYLIEYVLGMSGGVNEKASVGSAFHKGMELLALAKLAEQNHEDVIDAEELGLVSLYNVTPNWAIRAGFEHYKKLEQPSWDEIKFQEIQRLFNKALIFKCGAYDPRKQNIISVEHKFDIEIPDDWAKYKYTLDDGRVIEGQISIKGTIDLIIKEDNDTITIMDYKTGLRKDLKTGKEKGVKELQKDFQILLYYHVIKRLFPNKVVTFTIWYVKNGGPFTLAFDESHDKLFSKLLKDFVKKVQNNEAPKLTILKWFCQYVCPHFKSEMGGTSTCEFIHSEALKKGTNAILQEYGNVDAITRYGSGGGRQSKPNGV